MNTDFPACLLPQMKGWFGFRPIPTWVPWASKTQLCCNSALKSSSFCGTWSSKTSGHLRATSSTSKKLSSKKTKESKDKPSWVDSRCRLSGLAPKWTSQATNCWSCKAHSGRSLKTLRTSSAEAFLEAKQINRPAWFGADLPIGRRWRYKSIEEGQVKTGHSKNHVL